MTKERMEHQYGVNLDKVVFTPSTNGMYATSKTIDGFCILEEAGHYIIVNVDEWQQVHGYPCSLKEFEDDDTHFEHVKSFYGDGM